MIAREIYTLLNKLRLTSMLRTWCKSHTLQEFELRLVELGCTKVSTRNSTIYTTPNGVGKIEITDTEIIINPER